MATISVGDALENKLLDPQCLQGDRLIQIAPKLDARVWDAWNKSSAHRLNAYMSFYDVDEDTLKSQFTSVYDRLLPFEEVIRMATEQNSLALLKWLHALENPWRKFEWEPATFIGRSRQVGQWTFDTFPKLVLTPDQSEGMVQHFLWDESHMPNAILQEKWMPPAHKQAFMALGWSNICSEQQQIKMYAQRVMDVLLPTEQWNWQRRWEHIGKKISYTRSFTCNQKDKVSVSACRGAMIAALLHEAPSNIQMILCAFKCCRHPDEPNKGHPDAQFIRHHFFAEDAPAYPPSAAVAAAFLFIEGVDPDVEVGFVLDQLTRDPNTQTEVFSLDGLGIAP